MTVDFDQIQWPEGLELPWTKSDYEKLVEAQGEPFTISEKGSVMLNQMFFVEKYRLEHRVIYDSELGDFFEYNEATGLWKKRSADAIKYQFLEDMRLTAKETGQNGLFMKRTDALARGLVALLRAVVEQPDAFSHRPPAIHVKNGMIVFEDDRMLLKSFHPDYFSRNMCPFEFDPQAECPRFLNELLGTALSPEDTRL
ncbi:MAG: hypothetical protein ACFUZC_21310 [Chthoniobacteraceae bacterium]